MTARLWAWWALLRTRRHPLQRHRERLARLAERSVWGNIDPRIGVVHPERDDFTAQPDGLISFDVELSESEYEAMKARWLAEYGRRPVEVVQLPPLPEVVELVDEGAQIRAHYARLAHEAIGVTDVAVPGFRSAGSDTATPASPGATGELAPRPGVTAAAQTAALPAATNLPGPDRTGLAPPVVRIPPIPAGESSLPVPGAGDGRTHPTQAGGDRAPAAVPEWAQRLLDAADLACAVQRDVDHCDALRGAA